MIILDSDVMIDFLRPHSPLVTIWILCLTSASSVPFFTNNLLTVALNDGRIIIFPCAEMKWLVQASPEQQQDFSIESDGYGVWWHDLDDGIALHHLLSPTFFASGGSCHLICWRFVGSRPRLASLYPFPPHHDQASVGCCGRVSPHLSPFPTPSPGQRWGCGRVSPAHFPPFTPPSQASVGVAAAFPLTDPLPPQFTH